LNSLFPVALHLPSYPTLQAEEKEMATAAKQRFYDPEGDYAGLLKVETRLFLCVY